VIAAVVLAGGASTRFGSQKLLAPLGGRPVVRWSVEGVLASAVEEVVVVLGYEAAGVRRALAGLPVRCVENAGYAEGMSTSLHAGVAALPAHTQAAVVALGDQPSVGPRVVDALIGEYRTSGGKIVAPLYHGIRGTPVLFAETLFAELLATSGDEGARGVIGRDPSRVSLVEIHRALPPDVDTPAEYEGVAREWGARGVR
jgi:molybdenum cofactor cytidylyltransferase